MIDVLFAVFCSLAIYPYLIYPPLLYLASRTRPEPVPPRSGELPTVTLITAALNESGVIGEKVRNLATLEYPEGLYRAVIGSDGSTDDTVDIARRESLSGTFDGLEVVSFPSRRGKPAVLRDLIADVRTEIVVLSDANTFFAPDALRKLTRWFADPTVGCVCGRLVLSVGNDAGRSEATYWGFETTLKRWENRLGAVLGANGGIYAFRLSAYEPIADNTIIDDFVLAMRIRKRGLRIIFDGEALAREETAPAVTDEFRRRIRIGAGNFQALGMLRRLLLPNAGWTAFSFWSHKVARWLTPIWCIAALAIAATELNRPLYLGVVVLAVALAGLALLGWAAERSGGGGSRLFALPYAFSASNIALLLGLFRFLSGPQDGRWARTRRTIEPVSP